MANLDHKYLNNSSDGSVRLKQSNRYNPEEPEDNSEKDYTKMASTFGRCIYRFNRKRNERVEKRTLDLPLHIDYIQIHFFNFFNRPFFESRYINNFGIIPVLYNQLDSNVLFVIENQDKFSNFLKELEKFINTEDHNNPDYNTDIKFIESFEFYSTEKILSSIQDIDLVHINLIDDRSIYSQYFLPIIEKLIQFFDDNAITYNNSLENKYIEIVEPSIEQLEIIADNFDIIYSITSSLSGTIRPSIFQLPVRSFGFNITNSAEDLPIIGIIDSGVSNNNPLRDIIIQDDEFDITNTGNLSDNLNHGTGVALIAALGRKVYPNFSGDFLADAKILPIKIIDSDSSVISESKVIEMIKSAHQKYNIRIFTLTVGYKKGLDSNQKFSEYANKLDNLAYELDILILISTANRALQNSDEYPECFNSNLSNLSSPAESMNNLTIGAISDNIEGSGINDRLSTDPMFPAGYSKRQHIDFDSDIFKLYQKNANSKKPELVHCGGDYTIIDHDFFGTIMEESDAIAGLKVLSAQEGQFFQKAIGTSYATPFVANIAANILAKYPSLKMESIKALLINSANTPSLDNSFDILENYKRNNLCGYGLPNEQKSIYSNQNEITMILEDSIHVNTIKSYPIKFPDYLVSLEKQNSLLSISATICYKFPPNYKSQLSYCPIYMAFGFFKNLALYKNPNQVNVNTINDNKAENIKIKSSLRWSEDYYYRNKLLSNTQKITFSVRKQDLLNENNVFKLAIKSQHHKLLTNAEKSDTPNTNNFSIVINIKENPTKGALSDKLYNEIDLINNLENIAALDVDVQLDN
jgi:hypothetical protein